jgi:alpha-tubulin suppressor-like RCC1 family protein
MIGGEYMSVTLRRGTIAINEIEDSIILPFAHAGVNHSFVVMDGTSLQATGQNDFGQLGFGDTDNRSEWTKCTLFVNNTPIKQIASGASHSCVLLEDGRLYGTGTNYNGELGLGSATIEVDTFTQIADFSATIPGVKVKQVACSYHDTFVLLDNGSLYGAGQNDSGQLGFSDLTERTIFTQVPNPPSGSIKQIVADLSYLFILMEDGALWAIGDNGYGQLGIGVQYSHTFVKVELPVSTPVAKIFNCGSSAFILLEDNTLYGAGNNEYGQLGLNDTNNRTSFTRITNIPAGRIPVDIHCSNYATLMLLDDNTLWGSGTNEMGTLGLGNTLQVYNFTQITDIPNKTIVQISSEEGSSFIVMEDGTVLAAGFNGYGQLGIESIYSANTFTPIELAV